MTPRRLFQVLLPLTQLVTVVHKSVSQFSNQLVALRPGLDVHNFMLSPVLPGLLLCRSQIPTNKTGDHKSLSALHVGFHVVEEVQSSWSCSQGQDFQMTVELGENHTKLWSAAIALLNWCPSVSLSPMQPQPCIHKWRENLHEHFCCQPPKSAS